MGTKRGRWIAAVVAAAVLAGAAPPAQAQRDRGVNQPGAAGNRGVHDPGINQPGAVGNGAAGAGSARQTRAVGDPGVNQPGAAGNASGARDPGVNQPGATGNRRR
jgi:hypothetical protein